MLKTHRKQWGIVLCDFVIAMLITFVLKHVMWRFNRSTIFKAWYSHQRRIWNEWWKLFQTVTSKHCSIFYPIPTGRNGLC